MGFRFLTFDCKLLEHFLKNGSGLTSIEANPLPADAKITSAMLHPNGRTLIFTVESAEYPDEPIDYTGPTPLPQVVSPAFRRHFLEGARPLS